ncbi:ATP-binding protein [Poseidonibacter ostreae]|nr:ATP-binding protein [Poseidonibacter ostreae]
MNKHEFKIDKNILYSIIAKQAGTLEKSFLELVTNSIDAKATRIMITLDGKNFSFKDDGLGFESEETVHKFFGTFGTPHQENDATYGKFRMGRGQIMAFSKNKWQSNTFSMNVDIKNKGTNYDFKSNEPFVQGCLISGELYDELEDYEFAGFENILSEYVKFSQIPIYYNGSLISDSISSTQWDIETEDGYIKVDNNKRDLTVYNLGVKVVDYRRWDMGFGGIIVSKKPLEVNFARNDILKKSCNVWKSLYKEINDYLTERSKESLLEFKTLDDSKRASLSAKLITGEFDYAIGRKLKLFKDVKGICHPLTKISKLDTIAIGERFDRLAEKVHDEERAFVLDMEVLENFRVNSLEELYSMLKDSCRKYKASDAIEVYSKEWGIFDKELTNLSKDKLFIDDITSFNTEINIDYEILSEDVLTIKEILMLKSIRKHEGKIRKILNSYSSLDSTIRKIHVGKSEVAEAWTDGETYIAIDRGYLVASFGTASFMKICNLLLHEYIHLGNDEKTHVHNADFFELFHAVSQHHLTRYKSRISYHDDEECYHYYSKDDRDSLSHIALAMTRTYINLLEKNGIRVPKSLQVLSSEALGVIPKNERDKDSYVVAHGIQVL